MLRLNSLSKIFADPVPRPVLRGIDLVLADGEYVAIMGESGSGKSTLLNLIAGLERSDGGYIEMNGTRLDTLDDAAMTRLRRRDMGFVFQAFHILPQLSVERNVALPLVLNGLSVEDTQARTLAMIDAVGLAGRARSMPRQLSGGELQRTAIARALVHAPRLVLADEPTGNLDSDSAALVLALLRTRIAAAGAQGILVTHSIAAAATADRVLLLGRDGLREADA